MGSFTEPLLDTPQTVVAVPQFVLQDQGVSTLKDALRDVPGTSLAAGESGAQGDNLTIRGFTARNDIFSTASATMRSAPSSSISTTQFKASRRKSRPSLVAPADRRLPQPAAAMGRDVRAAPN